MHKELANLGLGNPLRLLAAGRNFVRTVWDPTRSDIRQGINALLYEALRDPDPQRIEERRAAAPGVARLYDEGYDPDIDPRRLEALPDGTLGREYARFIRQNRIDPLGDLLALRTPANFLEYSFRRAYKLHDVLHIVLGCDASILGEVQIVSFSLGQAAGEGARAPAMALAVLVLHLALRRPQDVQPAVRIAGEWMAVGARTRAYTSHRLEDCMERPVGEVREMVLAA
jgi:ubiquinone biosynthesis protein Coq4